MNESFDYFTVALIWSLLGFALGFGFAQYLNFVRFMKMADENDGTAETSQSRLRRIRRRMGQAPYFGWVLIVLALCTVLQVAYYTTEQREAVECLSEYNRAFAAATTVRLDINERDRASNVKLIQSTINSTSRETSQSALREYLETQKMLDEARDNNETPKFPESSDCH